MQFTAFALIFSSAITVFASPIPQSATVVVPTSAAVTTVVRTTAPVTSVVQTTAAVASATASIEPRLVIGGGIRDALRKALQGVGKGQ